MATTTAAPAAQTSLQAPTSYGSMSRDRKRALRWSYFFLILFVLTQDVGRFLGGFAF